jgi:hypothetical protein
MKDKKPECDWKERKEARKKERRGRETDLVRAARQVDLRTERRLAR